MIIFLDIDGVLNQLQGNYHLDTSCIVNLGILCRELNAKVVLTSSWRKGFFHDYARCTPQVKSLIDNCNAVGVEIIGRTKVLNDRFLEVMTYVREHDILQYIVLDDDTSEFTCADFRQMYVVNEKTGLTDKDVKVILRDYK